MLAAFRRNHSAAPSSPGASPGGTADGGADGGAADGAAGYLAAAASLPVAEAGGAPVEGSPSTPLGLPPAYKVLPSGGSSGGPAVEEEVQPATE